MQRRHLLALLTILIIYTIIAAIAEENYFNQQEQFLHATRRLGTALHDSNLVTYRALMEAFDEVDINARILAVSPAVQAALASRSASTVQDDVLEPHRRTAGLSFIGLVTTPPIHQIAESALTPATTPFLYATRYALQYQQDGRQIWDSPFPLQDYPYLIVSAPVTYNGHLVGAVVAGKAINNGLLGFFKSGIITGQLAILKNNTIVAASPPLVQQLTREHLSLPLPLGAITPWSDVRMPPPFRAQVFRIGKEEMSAIERPLGYGSSSSLAVLAPTPPALDGILLIPAQWLDSSLRTIGIPTGQGLTAGLVIERIITYMILFITSATMLWLLILHTFRTFDQLAAAVQTFLETNSFPKLHHFAYRLPHHLFTNVEQLVLQAHAWRSDSLQASERLYRVLDGIKTGIVLSEHNGAITYMNPVARELLGLEAQATLPPSMSSNGLLKGPLAASDGRTITACTAPILSATGEHEGLVTVLTDVSREQQLERARSDFLTIVSHELRTPLTAIKGALDLIIEGDAGEIDPVPQRFLLTARRNTERLIILVNDLLDFSRIEAGQIQLHMQSFDLRRSITDAIATLETIIESRHQSLATNLPVQPLIIEADRHRLEQILTNLLANASQYTPHHGRIEIYAEQCDSTHIAVRIRNTGSGIAREDLPHLFEKFYRGGNSLTWEESGSGLGLAIVKSLVDLHHGMISVTSDPQTFTEFTVILPSGGKSQCES